MYRIFAGAGTHEWPMWARRHSLAKALIAINIMVAASTYTHKKCRNGVRTHLVTAISSAISAVLVNSASPGLFLQPEGPGSEPGNSLVRPDGHM